MVRTGTAHMAHSLAAAAGGGVGGGRLTITKKVVLWSVLILQLGFIGCIWLLQVQPASNNGIGIVEQRVNFVRQKNIKPTTQQGRQGHGGHCARRHENVNRYEQDFYQMKLTDRVNRTAEYAAYVDLELSPVLWCYREGTLNESQQQRNDLDYLQLQPQCHCEIGWHGRDCGQPEIIWRALMTHSRSSSSRPLQLREASAGSGVQRLYYMLELGHWEHISLELLELQLRALIDVVDFFLIYYVSSSREQRLTYRSMERSLSSLLGSAGYMLYQCRSNCSTAAAYAQLHRQLWTLCGVQLQATDLLLYGDSKTIYAPAALKFLKYYAVDVLPLRFRLKHNVYGFYWQHPQRTLLEGVLSSLAHLHGDPRQLQSQASYTLGDLNHYGGWSCQFCLPPEQIVSLLQSSASRIPLPNDTRSRHIDGAYIQRLIGRGLHLDGSTELLRLREQIEKYFAPSTALLSGSHFAQLLVNLYDVEEDDDMEEE